MMALELMKETVETRLLNDQDILIMDYRNKHVTISQRQEINEISQRTGVLPYDIEACLEDHRDIEDYEDVYIVNGYTFMYVTDFLDTPVSRIESPSVDSSIKLYSLYAHESLHRARIIDVLDLTTGEVVQYYNHILALNAIGATTYDILKVPLYPGREITEYEHYIFPSVGDQILRFKANIMPWTEYVYHALQDYEALALSETDLEYK